MSKPTREAALVKPVVAVALEVADEQIKALEFRGLVLEIGATPNEGLPYETIDVLTRLRAAICLANDAGLSTDALVGREKALTA